MKILLTLILALCLVLSCAAALADDEPRTMPEGFAGQSAVANGGWGRPSTPLSDDV